MVADVFKRIIMAFAVALLIPAGGYWTAEWILGAVIGHELGHFRGADTAYSRKFAPVYSGLSHAIDTLQDEDKGADSLAKLPAISMLSLMLALFARNERRISRDREFGAYAVGVRVFSPEALATSIPMPPFLANGASAATA